VFALVKDGVFLSYLTNGDYRFSNTVQQPPQTLTSEEATSFGVVKVTIAPQPAYDPQTQTLTRGDAILVNGVWEQQWNIDQLPASQVRMNLKIKRQRTVDELTVTTAAGNVFDGDEMSQTRMTRAIIALQATGTASIMWILADNTTIQASVAELTEALVLAGTAQAAVWSI